MLQSLPRRTLTAPRTGFVAALIILPILMPGPVAPEPVRVDVAGDATAATSATGSVLVDRTQVDELRAAAAQLGAAPRVAGTDGAAAAARLIAAKMQGYGLEVAVHEYDVWLPHASEVVVERLGIGGGSVQTSEAALPQDAFSGTEQYPVAAGYSAAGDVRAPVVYANYGRASDFQWLQRAGVEIEGKIALVRYGGIFRGDKVRNAEALGAAAVVLYSDPADDGFDRGAVYPDGPFRPPSGIQRGSVKTGAPGDPASPGVAALVDRPRTAPRDGLPAIPVVALGYAAATGLLQDLGGVEAPVSWQGGLPLAYRTGDEVATLRVRVRMQDEPWRRIRNVVGALPGALFPDEWVILGAHYDSWTHGVVDNVSGTVAMLEAARVLGEHARAGNRPARTVVFAAWDAEEWGLVGSTEWVEEHARQLRDGAVAYLNLDGVAGGPFFSALASPALRGLVEAAARAVPDPVLPRASVFEGWMRRDGAARMLIPGGGSDYAPFTALAGVPALSIGFSAANGVYHSAYDTLDFMERFGDPGYRQHRAIAAMAAWMCWELATRDFVPYDYRHTAQEVVRGLNAAERALRHLGRANGGPGLARAWAAAGRVAGAAGVLRAVIAEQGSTQRIRVSVAEQVNRLMFAAHRQMLGFSNPTDGLWARSLLTAPDPADTYSALLLPRVATALRQGDIASAVQGIGDLADHLEGVAGYLERAVLELRPRPRQTAVAGN